MINLKIKIQNIYYQTDQDELGIEHATSEKRITLAEAEEVLTEREISFKEILRVKYEYIDLDLPLETFKKYIK